jgi:glycosyltransferase involved in cell wall biosynthesis
MSDQLTMLQTISVCWIGGVEKAAQTMVKAFPEYRHVIAILYGGDWINQIALRGLKSTGAIVLEGEPLSDAMLQKYDPFVVMTHSLARSPWVSDWKAEMTRRVIIDYNHGVAYEHLCSHRLWNSVFAKQRYGVTFSDGVPTRVLGSYIDTSPFEVIERSYSRGRVLGMVTSGTHRAEFKLDRYLLPSLVQIRKQVPDVEVILPNVGQKVADLGWCRTPNIERESVADYYRDIDIVVYMTGKHYSETWGRVITEAMAAGLPIVAERLGGIVEQIDDGVSGFLVGNHDELVARTVQLCNDEELRRKMGMAARLRACRYYGLAAIRRELADIFDEALEIRQKRSG